MTWRSRAVEVIGRVLIGWTALWLLLAVFVISVGSVVRPGGFLSDEAGLGVEVLGYFWAAMIPLALVSAVWDGIVRSPGGRSTAILIAALYALGLLVNLADPDSEDEMGEWAALGLFTLGPGVLGGLLRAVATGAMGRRGAREAPAAGGGPGRP